MMWPELRNRYTLRPISSFKPESRIWVLKRRFSGYAQF